PIGSNDPTAHAEIVTSSPRGFAQRHNLGMRGRIVGADWLGGSAPRALVFNYDDGADGDLARITRPSGFVPREAHEETIICVGSTKKVGRGVAVCFSVC